MIMTTVQKIIKIGSSKGVTLPAKQLKQLGVEAGDEVRITIERALPKDPQADVLEEYAAFVDTYDEALRNLADR